MRHQPTSRQILGFPFWLLAMPMCFFGWLSERNKERVMPTPESDPHEWMRTHWCSFCERDTDQVWREFRDEPVVERVCMECAAVATYWDTK